MKNLPALTSTQQHLVRVAESYRSVIQPKHGSLVLTAECVEAGVPTETAELCAGMLASVVHDLETAARLPKTSFERAKCLERVLEAAQEPRRSALRLAMAASPINGRAAVRLWDELCPAHEVGAFAWWLDMNTEPAKKYHKRRLTPRK